MKWRSGLAKGYVHFTLNSWPSRVHHLGSEAFFAVFICLAFYWMLRLHFLGLWDSVESYWPANWRCSGCEENFRRFQESDWRPGKYFILPTAARCELCRTNGFHQITPITIFLCLLENFSWNMLSSGWYIVSVSFHIVSLWKVKI